MSPAALAARIQTLVQPRLAANRSALAAVVQRFHDEIGTAPNNLQRSLARIRNGRTIIRLAHQPNFLPYDNLLLQLRYLHHLECELTALGQEVVAIVLLVDHDIAANRRFRNCEYFDPAVDGMVGRIRYPTSAAHTLIADQAVPPLDYFTALSARLESLSRHLLTTTRQPSIARDILAELVPSHLNGLTTTHVTSFAWARVAYQHDFAPNVVFAPLSMLQHHLRSVYLALSECVGPDAKGFERYWTLCPACRGRQRMRRVGNRLVAECTHCHKQTNTMDPLQDGRIRVIPRVLIDILSDYVGLDVSGGTAYASRLDRIAPAHALAHSFGIASGHEAVWRANVLHTGVAGKAAHLSSPNQPLAERLHGVLVSGRMGMAHYLAAPQELAHLRSAFDGAAAEGARAPSCLEVVSGGPRAVADWLRAALHTTKGSHAKLG